MPRRYALAPGLSWRRFEDETAVYVEARFETHLLSWSGGLLLELLDRAAAPCSAEQLRQQLFSEPEDSACDAAAAPRPADPQEQAVLDELLQRLLRLGVIAELSS